MKQAEYYLFETTLGVCAIGWTISGSRDGQPVVTFFQLPETTKKLTEQRIAAITHGRRANAPPSLITGIIKKVQRHLKGELQDFQDIDVDLEGAGQFARQVYMACRNIPAGKTMTYGELARAIKRPTAARSVGQALGNNPIPLIIPCHRVLASGSKPGGFSAAGGVELKARMLDIEGATIGPPATIKSKKDLLRAATLLKKKDPRLGRALSKPIEWRLRPEQSPYETLVEAVVRQQLATKAAAAILGRVLALYPGSRVPAPADLLNTPDASLRSAGLSRTKTRSVKDIAAKTLDGTVPSSKEIISLSNEEIIKRLTSIYGVGQWTVEMMLIFNLGRMDVFAVDDYALRKSVSAVFNMEEIPTPKQLDAMSEAWRPYRTVAALYLWNSIKN
jgi:O-6-methylguanine DNA methyltransferase